MVSADLAVETVDLRVDYGDVHAVRDVNLAIPKGELYGLIGPNGAGKTTSIRVLATLQEPTYGEVFVHGIDVAEHPQQVHAAIGYMPDFPPIYDDMRVWEFLDLFAAAYFLDPAKRKGRVEELTEQVNLTSKRDALCGGLSRGMRQRLILAKTMLHEPPVLILDEPASGLDPLSRIELRDTLRSFAAQGRTILISSHILTELSGFCTSIGVMESGRLVVSGPLDQVIAQFSPHRILHVRLLRQTSEARAVIEAQAGVLGTEVEDLTITVQFEGEDDALAAMLVCLVEAKIPVAEFHERKIDVEDVFLKVGAQEVS